MVLCNPDDDDTHEGAIVTICQGPPSCLRDDPPAETMRSCLWCKRIFIAPDGSEAVLEPARA